MKHSGSTLAVNIGIEYSLVIQSFVLCIEGVVQLQGEHRTVSRTLSE